MRLFRASLIWVLFGVLQLATAQELEPRRWSHLPVGANFIGVGGVYTDKDILFNPTLQLEDVKGDIYTGLLAYTRVFGLFGKSARVDVLAPYSTARWDGKQQGEPASVRRRGFNDPRVRFAINLVGSPAQSGEAFRRFQASTIVGAAVEVTVPVGENQTDKLLNLGGNRWVLKPQIGIVHNWGKWSAEFTGTAWFYEDNDNFFDGKKREQDPTYGIQTHVIYTFRPGLWVSLSGAYGTGGGSTVDDVRSADRLDKTIWAVSLGLPVTRKQGVKLAYLRGDTHTDTGNDFNTYIVAYSVMWGGD